MKNGLNTGIKAFDEMVGEIQPGELIVIAGRPGMGKTTLALQILAKNCIDKISAWLSTNDVFLRAEDRICHILANLNHCKKEQDPLRNTNTVIEHWICDTDFITLCIDLTKLKTEKGLDYVFIDGFQLLSPDISANLRAKWLKDLAQSLGITIFVTSQMNRSRDCNRIDCTTINYHLYYMADKVLGVYRKDYFMTIADIGKIEKGESFLTIVKNNTGKQGAITAYFNYARCSFSENFIDEGWYKPNSNPAPIKDS